MNVIEAIESRRAVKHFDPKVKLTEQEVEQMMSKVILSPTCYNIQNWRFVRITSEDSRQAMLDAAWGQKQIVEASELFVLCADVNAWRDRPQRYFANTSPDVKETMLGMLENFYTGKSELQKQEAYRSCGIAAQTMMLTAKALGYDTCPMMGFDHNKVANIIQLPDNHLITMLIVVGKALKPAHPRAGQLPLSEVLVENAF
jgi:nitroreductase